MENMENSELKTVQHAPTGVGMLAENNKLISECLYKADKLYQNLTNDSFFREDSNSIQPVCILSDLTIQNENLSLLNRILEAINANVLREEN